MIEVALLAQAERDLFRLYAGLENHTPGRGDRFSDDVEKVLNLLRRLPRIGRVVGHPYRRIKLSHFPFSIIYAIEERRLFVHAIASNYEPLDSLLQRLRQG